MSTSAFLLALTCLAAIAALSLNPWLSAPAPTPVGVRIVTEILAWPAAAILAMRIWMEYSVISVLVNISITGIMAAFNIRLPDVDIDVAARQLRFLRADFFLCVTSALAIVVARQVGRSRRGDVLGLLAWTGLGVLCSATAAIVAWRIHTVEFLRSFPLLADGRATLSQKTWISICLTLAVVAVILAFRFARSSRESADGALIWSPLRRYAHQSRFWAVMLALSVAANLGHDLYEMFDAMASPLMNWQDIIGFWLCQPCTLLWMGVLLAAARSALGRRVPLDVVVVRFPLLLPGRFVVALLIVAFAIPAGAMGLTWLGFAAWFSPWITANLP